MALVTLREVLAYAEKNKTAIAGFNIDNLEVPKALVEAAEALNTPIILTIGQGAINAGGLEHLSDVVKRLAAGTDLPLVMHLDHGASYEQTIQCIRAGFSSVMIDGSHLPLEENIALTKQVVQAAQAVGISVEAELGAIGGVEDGIEHQHKNLVDCRDVEAFIAEVSVDALAVGIGNAHGIYKGEPNLDFGLLERVKALNPPALVLHGGSGIPDAMIQKAIEIGVRKINVATEVRLAFMEGVEAAVGQRDIYKMYQSARERVVQLASEKIKLFNRV